MPYRFVLAVMLLSIVIGCRGQSGNTPAPAPVDPLPPSSDAEANRNSTWDSLQQLLAENNGALPRVEVKDLLIYSGGTSYSQQFSSEVGSWPENGVIYVYGWKAKTAIHAIVARIEGDTVDLNDSATTLLEKRDFPLE